MNNDFITLLSEDETAALLGISKRHLFNEKSLGRIKFVKLGRRILYSKAQILEYVESNSCHHQPKMPDYASTRTRHIGSSTITTMGKREKSQRGVKDLMTLKKR